MNLKCISKRLILFFITFPAAIIFSIWTGYMIGTVFSFANFEFIPYKNSAGISINLFGAILTLLYYFYILFFKLKTK